jgi:predicted nuclease with TOPRIM domain
MTKIDDVRSKLRLKRQEYQDLRNDYELLRQNIHANVEAKKVMRKELDILTKEYRTLKNVPEPIENVNTGTDSLL